MRRILKEKFRLGLFDHPYLEPAGVKVINNAGFAAKGIEAQQKSLVLLKNEANILPLTASTKIFLEGFSKEETKGITNLVNDAAAADVIVLKIGTPDNAGPEKYILQKLFNHGSLAFSDKEEARLLKIIQSKPTITIINLQRPAVIPGINKYTKALIADFSSQDNVILDLIMGKFKPTGKLPFELPSSMEEVLKQKEDMPYDTKNPLYKFGAGIGYN
jgi:beta-glucosidase